MAESEHFPDGFAALGERLPQWWAQQDPSSELHAWLGAFGELVDELSAQAEQLYADSNLATASRTALVERWAPLLGAAGEDAPFNTEQLRAYLQAVAVADGSRDGLYAQLMAILLADPANADTADVVTFPLDGSGITLSDAGTALYQGDGTPSEVTFPVDASGLDFPLDSSGLPFPTTSWVEIVERPADHAFDVYVRNYLSFDRPAFARAVARFTRPALFTATITETTEPHV